MSKIIILALAFLLTVFITPLVFAQQFSTDKQPYLSKSAVVSGPYFAAGQTVIVDGTVGGDTYVAGGSVTFNGTINGDLLAVGGNIIIRGHVTHNVRVAGGNVVISGTVNGNVTAAGGNVEVLDSAVIEGDLVSGSGNLKVFGPIGKNVVAGGGTVMLDQKIGGNAVVGTQELIIGSYAGISKDLTYYSGQKAAIQQGATIAGQTVYHQTAMSKRDRTEVVKTVGAAAGGAWIFFKLMSLFSTLILGLIIVNLAPVFSTQAMALLEKKPWASMGFGFLILILAPILLVIIAVTLIGLPLAFFAFFLYLLTIFISKIFIALWIGLKVVGNWQNKPSLSWSLVAGLIIWYILTGLPFIGGLLSFLSLITGLGVLYLQKKATFMSLRTKKLL